MRGKVTLGRSTSSATLGSEKRSTVAAPGQIVSAVPAPLLKIGSKRAGTLTSIRGMPSAATSNWDRN